MSAPRALLDSNAVVAIVAEAHEHNGPSLALIAESPARALAVAAHSFAEAYSTLTRRSAAAPFRWSAEEAWTVIQSVAGVTVLASLSPGQTFDTIRSYAGDGGVGPRLYDRLIGQVAVQDEIPLIVTWNVAHMRDLFPALEVLDPIAAIRAFTGSQWR